MSSTATSDLITLAISEDLGTLQDTWNASGDVTSRIFIPRESLSQARIVARTECVVSGLDTAIEVFSRIDSMLEITLYCKEGDHLSKDATLLEVRGSTRSILSAERTALNFLGRLCGIATLASLYANAVADTGVQLLDTRKTTPGWRLLEKQAVKAGGCVNHRMGLYDAVLVKDNHLAALGDLALLPPIITRLRAEHAGLSIEIEADTLEQVQQLLTIPGIDVILLDNMSPGQVARAVSVIKGRAQVEVSGGVRFDTLGLYAIAGVDVISVGALTHSAPAADLSLTVVARRR